MATVYYIPNGPANLSEIFPEIDFNEVAEYYVEVMDEDENVVATTPINMMGCCCGEDAIRVHFLNEFNCFDAINLIRIIRTFTPESDKFKTPLPNTFIKESRGWNRRLVGGKTTIEAYNQCYDESALEWIRELFSSPIIFLEQRMVGKNNEYLPAVFVDRDLLLTDINRFIAKTPITIELANDLIPLRT